MNITLGRTPEGAIKIKKDGGLRAVNCACCGVCRPEVIRQYASEELLEVLRNASGGICNGMSATQWLNFSEDDPSGDGIKWIGTWIFGDVGADGYFVNLIAYWGPDYYILEAINFANPQRPLPNGGAHYLIDGGAGCCGVDFPSFDGYECVESGDQFSINGVLFPNRHIAPVGDLFLIPTPHFVLQ
jgi:hypothetical protein